MRLATLLAVLVPCSAFAVPMPEFNRDDLGPVPTVKKAGPTKQTKKMAAFRPTRRDNGRGIAIRPEDYKACADGDMSMDVDVYIDGEKFSMNPSCAFSFDEDIETRKGVECEIEAGMCSPFSPKGRFVVECEDDRKASIPILCKNDDDGKPGDIAIIFDEPLDCYEGEMSTDVEVIVDKESFQFNPSCAFSMSKKIKTKKGMQCSVKAGMCSPFSPKNRFIVECKDGRKSSHQVPCRK